jgi:hypothetical protein
VSDKQQMQALRLTLWKINDWVKERLSVSLTFPMHPYKPGDAVWVKEWNVQPLKPQWRGPFVVLSTSTAVKVAGIIPWIHHNQVKPASLEWECIPDPARLPSGTPVPFPSKTLLLRRQQETTNNET